MSLQGSDMAVDKRGTKVPRKGKRKSCTLVRPLFCMSGYNLTDHRQTTSDSAALLDEYLIMYSYPIYLTPNTHFATGDIGYYD